MKSGITRVLLAGMCGTMLMAGCQRPTLLPNPDPSLRKTKSQLAADASQRCYREYAPRAYEDKLRAQVAYIMRRLEILNFTEEDWNDVEVWVNQRYVCHLPQMQAHQLKVVDFAMLYDANGKTYPQLRHELIEKVEVYRDGKLYTVKHTVTGS